MKRKKAERKMTLARDTVRQLDSFSANVAGGKLLPCSVQICPPLQATGAGCSGLCSASCTSEGTCTTQHCTVTC